MPPEHLVGHLLVSRLGGKMGEKVVWFTKALEKVEQNLPPVAKPSSVEWHKAG